MSKPKVFFIGKPYLHALDWLIEHDYELYHLFDREETYQLDQYFVQSFPLDVSSDQALHHSLSQISIQPDLIQNNVDSAIILKAKVCQFYNLPGPSVESALLSSDKTLMRAAFQKNCPQYSPQFQTVEKWSDIEEFVSKPNINFPLILKPANLSKSLLVSKTTNLEELKTIYQQSLQIVADIYQREKVHLKPHFIIEECLIGPAYSLEVFCDQTGNCVSASSAVDLIMARDININDNYNYSRKLPSQLTAEQQLEIKKAAFAGCQALKLTSVPAHVELFYTNQGPKIIEIGAREGGFRRKMHLLSEGIDLNFTKIDVAYGKLPKITATKNDGCAVYEIFPDHEGTLAEVTNLGQLKTLSSFYDYEQKREIGEKIGLAAQGHRAVSVITLHNNDLSQFAKDCQFLEQYVKAVCD